MTDLDSIQGDFERALAGAADERALEEIRIRFLGRNGLIAAEFSRMSEVPPEGRRARGADLNKLKGFIESKLKEAQSGRSGPAARSAAFDVTLPARSVSRGAAHPVLTTLNDICDIFGRAGFEIAGGPEAETDWYNFGALNVPADHPARDMHDTFYIADCGLRIADLNSRSAIRNPQYLLRTHTSPVQIHVMEKRRPPVRVIAPGRVYRRDDDVSHAPMFHQVEGLWVDRGVTMRDLRGLLEYFAKTLFGSSVHLRLRPSFFPFTEPSLEVDVSCVICGGESRQRASACRTCKSTGWLEILGAGMVHPNVFKSVKIDPSSVTGLAFGMGVERIAMLRYAISDIRLFYENDVRFVAQFGALG
ncbi:phenylalanine--tRNA ligase subunit alpha [bacterium]|nr:phenylalanine--tRNA ligase subunit alpha [bacterium]